MKINLNSYSQLIDDYLNDKVSTKHFEKTYLKTFIEETGKMTEKEYALLNGLFMDIEAFCDNPDLFDQYSIDESKLKNRCKVALEKLRRLKEKG